MSCLETYIKKLLGRADIEDALKRLDNLIREEHQAATAEVLLVTSELRDGVQPFRHDSNAAILNLVRIGSNRTNTTMQQIVNDVDDVKCMQFPITFASMLNLRHRESDTTGCS